MHGRSERNEVTRDRQTHESRDAQGAHTVESTMRSVHTSATTGSSAEEKTLLAELLRCPDFAPPSAMGRFGKAFFGETRWRKMRIEVRRWLAHLQPVMGGLVGGVLGGVLVSFLLVVLHLDDNGDPLLNRTPLGYFITLAVYAAMFCFGAAGFMLLRFLAPKWQRTFEKRMHEEALAKPARDKWAELYYCEHDDIVYLPNTKEYAAAKSIKQFCLHLAGSEQIAVINAQARGRAARRAQTITE